MWCKPLACAVALALLAWPEAQRTLVTTVDHVAEWGINPGVAPAGTLVAYTVLPTTTTDARADSPAELWTLDVATGILVLEAIARINTELGTTAVVITHNAAIAAMADRVISLSDGRIANVRCNSTRAKASELSW